MYVGRLRENSRVVRSLRLVQTMAPETASENPVMQKVCMPSMDRYVPYRNPRPQQKLNKRRTRRRDRWRMASQTSYGCYCGGKDEVCLLIVVCPVGGTSSRSAMPWMRHACFTINICAGVVYVGLAQISRSGAAGGPRGLPLDSAESDGQLDRRST